MYMETILHYTHLFSNTRLTPYIHTALSIKNITTLICFDIKNQWNNASIKCMNVCFTFLFRK